MWDWVLDKGMKCVPTRKRLDTDLYFDLCIKHHTTMMLEEMNGCVRAILFLKLVLNSSIIPHTEVMVHGSVRVSIAL